MTILPPEQHSSGSKASYTKKKSAEKVVDLKTKEKEAVRPHAKIPHEDLDWLLTQRSPVIRLFLESWRCESFGKQERLLKTTLRGNNLRQAIRVMEKAGLFKYQPVMELINSRWVITAWKCENLHGYYCDYWDVVPSDSALIPSDSAPVHTENVFVHSENVSVPSDSAPVHTKNAPVHTVSVKRDAETRSKTDSAKFEPTLNQNLTTPQPPTKVVEEGSSIPQETHQTPSKGAGATSGRMQEEEKDAPDTSIASVEDKQEVNGIPINLGEDQSSGGGDIATELSSNVAYTEFPFQVGSQITINWPNYEHDGKTGTVEKLYWGHQEVDVRLERTSAVFCFPMARILGSGVAPSTKARFNPEHAQNRKARQSRLKCADMLGGECPGAEFLTECWQDILLRSQVKGLIAKYPQWGIFVDSADQLQSWFD